MFGIPTLPVVTRTLTAATSSVTLYYASPGGTPRHLVLRTSTQATSGNPNLLLRFNGDSGSNYNSQVLYGYSTTTGAWAGTSQTSMSVIGNIDDLSSTFSVSETLFPDALSTRTDKSVLSIGGRIEEVVEPGVGRWESTAAITSVTCFVDSSTFAAGSTFELCVVDEAYLISGGETINTGTADFDKSSISAADGDLVIIGNLRSNVASNLEELGLQFNNDSTDGNYERQRMTGHNSSIKGAYSSASTAVSHAAGANADADSFSGFLAQIVNFSDGSNDRSAITLGGGHMSDSDQQLATMGFRWNNTAAIDRIQVVARNGSGWLTNSMLSIYAVPKGLIDRQELSGDTTTVTFGSIPGTYDHLELTAYSRGTSAGVPTRALAITLNSDTTDANYKQQVLYGQAGTLAAYAQDGRNLTTIPAATATANIFAASTHTFYNYAKTDRHKSYFSTGGFSGNHSVVSARWTDTSAISTIALTVNADDYLAGSVFTLRGISATPSSSDAANINSIVIGSIAAINSIAIASVQAMNNVALAVAGGGTSYAGITWSTDDTTPVSFSSGIHMGIIGAEAIVNANDKNATGYKATYEHDGSSWSTTGNCAGTHGVGAGGGTQTAGVIFNGWDDVGGDESNVTEEYNGSTWATGNNTVEGSAYVTGGGSVQTAQLCTGGSAYSPTRRDLSMTQTYNGTNWANESVASNGRSAASSGESGGGGLDAFFAASGSLDASGEVTSTQLFNQTAGSWTSKAAVSDAKRYTGSSTDGTRVYKIGGYDGGGAASVSNLVESWVDNTWTTESVLTGSRNQSGAGTGSIEAAGGASAIGGNDASGLTNTYFIAAAS